jgi:hypothetical protein
MNLEEFQTQTRNALEQTLNELQVMTLMAAQLERQIAETGRSVQTLSRMIESFTAAPTSPDACVHVLGERLQPTSLDSSVL